MNIVFDESGATPWRDQFASFQTTRRNELNAIVEERGLLPDVRGWLEPSALCPPDEVRRIERHAERYRNLSDTHVVIGVGGSNGSARALIQSLGTGWPGPRTIFMGTSLSARQMAALLDQLENRSVVVTVIAKNFATLEPGVAFRIMGDWMQDRYAGETAQRIACIGSPGDRLARLARERGYACFAFPESVGGRYSSHSAVGLLPVAVAGGNIRAVIEGGMEARRHVQTHGAESSAIRYAVCRSALRECGHDIEMLASFEPSMDGFAQWWRQLFAESEGKKGRGIFPATAAFTEDLHSVGQYIQDGPRRLFETVLDIPDPADGVAIPTNSANGDGFAYLEGWSLAKVNRVAFEATVEAHKAGSVPVLQFRSRRYDEASLGAWFYLFEYACYASARLLEVNPFDQPGVEAYKRRMLDRLKG